MANLSEEGVLISMHRVNTPEIFPEYAERDLLRSLLAQVRVDIDQTGTIEGTGQIAVDLDEETGEFSLHYYLHNPAHDQMHRIPLTTDQATHMIFLFSYYRM